MNDSKFKNKRDSFILAFVHFSCRKPLSCDDMASAMDAVKCLVSRQHPKMLKRRINANVFWLHNMPVRQDYCPHFIHGGQLRHRETVPWPRSHNDQWQNWQWNSNFLTPNLCQPGWRRTSCLSCCFHLFVVKFNKHHSVAV